METGKGEESCQELLGRWGVGGGVGAFFRVHTPA
jgi:hypothetical protein